MIICLNLYVKDKFTQKSPKISYKIFFRLLVVYFSNLITTILLRTEFNTKSHLNSHVIAKCVNSYLSCPKNKSKSSSTVPIPAILKFFTSTFATFGDRNPGSVGPR